MVKVDVTDPIVASKLKAAGVRWRMKNMEEGLEIPLEQAKELGITKVALAKAAVMEEKAEAKAARLKAAEEAHAIEVAEEASAVAAKKAKTDAAAAAKAATAAIAPTPEQIAAAKAAELARRAK